MAWLAERSVVDGDPLSDEAARDWAVRDSPIQHRHIRPYGRYQFNTITRPTSFGH